MNRAAVASAFRELQDEICIGLQDLDPKLQITEDNWQRQEGGGGCTRVLDGEVFESGGVNFSEVHGTLPTAAAKALMAEGSTFHASGVSIVIHPRSPMVPIIHMNVRHFELDSGTSWFGGGIDLTPVYYDAQEAEQFHAAMKAVCDRHDPSFHKEFSEWAKRYFTIKHRGESRGIGGIFFDRLNAERGPMEALFAFVLDVGRSFVPTYGPMVRAKKDLPYGEHEKRWQSLRRGRYVEFNLVQDRGTRFGLETGGRTESILMSLPRHAEWAYDHHPAPGSREEETLLVLRSLASKSEMS